MIWKTIGKKIQHKPAFCTILKDKKGASTIYRELYIYRSKVQGTGLNVRVFIKDIFKRYNMEKMITKNSIKFRNNWDPYIDLFKSLI